MISDPRSTNNETSELNQDHMGELLEGHLESLDCMIEGMMARVEGSGGIDGLLSRCMTYLDDLSDGVLDGSEWEPDNWRPETAESSPVDVSSGTNVAAAEPTDAGQTSPPHRNPEEESRGNAAEEAKQPAENPTERETRSRPATIPNASGSGTYHPAGASKEPNDESNADKFPLESPSIPRAPSSETVLHGLLESADGQRMRFKCPYCNESVRAPVTVAGRKAQCPNQGCGKVVRIPRP